MSKTFITRKIAFFELFVCSDHLGPIEINLQIAQIISRDLLDPYNLFPDFCHVRYYEKTLAKLFSSLRRLPLFQKIAFSTTS